MRSLIIGLMLAGAAVGSAQAQTSRDVRISGTVEKFDGRLISISPSKGITLVVRFDAGPGINSMRKAKPGDIKTGQQVRALTKTNPAGGVTAGQIIIYENGAEQSSPDAVAEGTPPLAQVTDVGASPDGPVLSLTTKDGVRKATVAKDAVIWTARPASAEDIKPGALITIAGTKDGDAEIKVLKASVGLGQSDNPPL
jgi:hypothetical protein